MAVEGVSFRVARMSFGRRAELLERVRELSNGHEFHAAGESIVDKAQAAAQSMAVDRVYWQWGLLAIEGLTIDGQPATQESTWASGPEELAAEILKAIRGEAWLSEDERKN